MIPEAFVMVEGRINDRWDLALTSDRCEFHKARPTWEAGRLAHMAERVELGMTVYDVGAECGDFTGLYATWVGPEGTVVPMEPKPEMWPSIRLHWDANTLGAPRAWWPGFAGDVDDLEPWTGYLDECGWPADLWPTWADELPQVDPGFRHVRDGNAPQITLDALAFATDLLPDVVVIDVEGAEWNVLTGALRLCETKRPVFYVSVHDVGDESWPGALSGWYGKTADDLDDLMVTDRRYTRTELEAHGEGERFFVYTP